ncbi:MAG: DUF1778 domain-containing protein [Actinomycetia bacterium]|nr:DUF1778 domain-containing protein [Actinomycetes bacterium]MCP5028905.1 DUF1778 domain-containing protein [Actinomycetes bacterium]
MAVHHWRTRNVATGTKRTRSERIEVRTTPEDRSLIDRAVAAADTDLTSFVMSNLTVAARRVLADRTEFALDTKDRATWEAVNDRPPRDLAGLRALMDRPSPFADE